MQINQSRQLEKDRFLLLILNDQLKLTERFGQFLRFLPYFRRQRDIDALEHAQLLLQTIDDL